MLARSFLIESSSKLLVTRTGIKARTSLISGWIRLLTFLEWQKFYTFELEYLWDQLANIDQILCVASLGMGKGCMMFWGRLDQNWCPWQQKAPIDLWGARWLSGRVSDSGARGPGFETYRRRVVSLSKTLYSPKVLVNYPGSDGSVPTWLKNCWQGR